ncbi:hypothetical protein PSHT_05405, partial [Puccinia striiformis]
MVAQGIHHRLPKDIWTKIIEIQSNFAIACNFLRNTGQGLLAKDIANGTNNIRSALIKKCKYYYDLVEVMGVRENANPTDIVDSTSELVPNLNAESEPEPNEEDRADPLLLLLTDDIEEYDTKDPPEPTTWVNNTSSPAPDLAAAQAGSKSKASSKKSRFLKANKALRALPKFPQRADHCYLHESKLTTIPDGINGGWPTQIDFGKLLSRVQGFQMYLEHMILGQLPSQFFDEVVEQYQTLGVYRACDFPIAPPLNNKFLLQKVLVPKIARSLIAQGMDLAVTDGKVMCVCWKRAATLARLYFPILIKRSSKIRLKFQHRSS